MLSEIWNTTCGLYRKVHCNQTESIGAGSGPINVQFACGGSCSFGKEGTDYAVYSVIFSWSMALSSAHTEQLIDHC